MKPQPTRGYDLSPQEKASDIVMGLPAIAIEGNVLPPQWLKYLRFPNGKPHTIAAILLSDVVYWYRPILLRDEATGEVSPPRKKFQGDFIQRSYKTYVDLYGFTKRQVRDAFHYLESEGLVKLHFQTVNTSGGKLGNVLFIELNIARLAEITTPPMTLERNRSDVETSQVLRQNVTGITPERQTNTDTITETTTKKKGEATASPPGMKTLLREKFLELTKLPPPTLKQEDKFWWSRFREIEGIFTGFPEDAALVGLEKVVKYMEAQGLTISGPESVIKLCRSYVAQEKKKKQTNVAGNMSPEQMERFRELKAQDEKEKQETNQILAGSYGV